MEAKADGIDISAGVVGLVGLYPLLLASNRMYFHLALPGGEWDWTIFLILISPLLLLLSGFFLVVRGRALVRAVGVLFLAIDIWWVWVLCHTDF